MTRARAAVLLRRLRTGVAPARRLGHPRAGRALERPWRTGLALLLLLGAALLSAQALLGRTPFGPAGERGDFYVAVVHLLLAAYLPAAYLTVLRSAQRRLEQLRPLRLAQSAPSGPPALPPLGHPSRGWVLAAALGALLGIAGPFLTEPHLAGPLGFWNPAGWNAETAWHRALGLFVSTWGGWFAFAVLRTSGEFSRAARELREVDPFDLRPLGPFVQQGLTNGLLAAGLLSLGGLFALDQGVTPLLVLLTAISLALVGAALALPSLGVRRRIRDAKRAELEWCDAEIHRLRRDVRRGAAEEPRGRLADLAAYRALLEQVREWPFDTPALRRMLLYLLLPLGSWVASALVQHAIERAIAGQ